MTGPGTRRWWALGAMVLAVFAVTLDVTVLTVALPTLAGALKASESQLQWFVTAYTLALVAGMLPAGLLGDRYGRKLIMSAGLVLFVIGSLGCAYAPKPGGVHRSPGRPRSCWGHPHRDGALDHHRAVRRS